MDARSNKKRMINLELPKENNPNIITIAVLKKGRKIEKITWDKEKNILDNLQSQLHRYLGLQSDHTENCPIRFSSYLATIWRTRFMTWQRYQFACQLKNQINKIRSCSKEDYEFNLGSLKFLLESANQISKKGLFSASFLYQLIDYAHYALDLERDKIHADQHQDVEDFLQAKKVFLQQKIQFEKEQQLFLNEKACLEDLAKKSQCDAGAAQEELRKLNRLIAEREQEWLETETKMAEMIKKVEHLSHVNHCLNMENAQFKTVLDFHVQKQFDDEQIKRQEEVSSMPIERQLEYERCMKEVFWQSLENTKKELEEANQTISLYAKLFVFLDSLTGGIKSLLSKANGSLFKPKELSEAEQAYHHLNSQLSKREWAGENNKTGFLSQLFRVPSLVELKKPNTEKKLAMN